MSSIFRYVKNLGFNKGLDNWLRNELIKSSLVKPKNCKHPVFVRPETTDIEVFYEVFLYFIYDIPFSNPKSILDLGSNVGYTSVFFANKYPDAHIIGVEPDLSNYEYFLKNTSHYPNIKGVHGAIWNEKKTLKISNPGSGEWSRQVEPDHEGGIQSYTIKELMDQFGLKDLDVVKIDIEGAERHLFESNTDWLKSVNSIIIELHDNMVPDSTATFFKAIEGFKYKMTVFQGNLFIQFNR